MKSDDELLDEVIAHLRTEPVPEMPAVGATRQTSERSRWVGYTVSAGALAVCVALLLFWRSHVLPTLDDPTHDVVQQRHEDADDSEVTVLAIDLTEPFAQLEANLGSIDTEITELRRKAALLDARRLADELLARL